MSKLSGRVGALDILRSAAILLVMAHHFRHLPGTPEWFKWFGLRGYIGVDVFFVLSGWLIGGQLFRELRRTQNIEIWQFWIKRWMRTLPLYYGVFIFEAYRNPRLRDHVFEILFFTQNYTDPHSWLITWSLCIEEHFYIALPILVLAAFVVAKRKPRLVVVACLALTMTSVIWRWVDFETMQKMNYNEFLGRFYVPTHLRMDGLWIGVCFAALRETKHTFWLKLTRRPSALVLAGAFIAFNAAWNPYFTGWTSQGVERQAFFNAVPQFFLVSLGVGLIIAGAVVLYENGQDLSIVGATWLAEHAYALYLIHWTASGWISRKLPWPGSLLVAFGISCAAAFVLRFAIERPGLRLREKFLNRKRA